MSSAAPSSTPLPVRTPGARSRGRHRRPELPQLPVDAPALLLAVPGEASAAAQQTADELVSLIRAEQPGIDVHAAYLASATGPVDAGSAGTDTVEAEAADNEAVAGDATGGAVADGTALDGTAFDGTALDGDVLGSDVLGGAALLGGAVDGGVDGVAVGTVAEELPVFGFFGESVPREPATLAGLLGEAHAAGRPAPIVVPLVPGTDAVLERVLEDISATLGEIRVTEPLGPHPLLAEALHVRLSEAGLARADRARLFAVNTAADGIVLVVTGGIDSLQRAEVTGVLLAARLAVPVVAAALDQPGSVAAAVAHLRATGCAQPALAPCLIGPEADADLLKAVAHETDCPASEVLGAYPTIARLALGHYLGALGIDQDPTQT
ncbi:sirohydrochlorin chelatase [Streptacidiphilus sp. EB129]|uniref:sirohydrochlorin chelatase n=1 Tax=Streptacidiphilus sp. EB129 TaxID=3156262 RepID=UPI0035131286